MSDDLSGLLDQWARERPDLDVTPMAVFARIARLHRAQLEASERALAPLSITGSEFDVLATLRRSGRPYRLTPSELIASLLISSGGVTQRVDRLESRGLVERRPSGTDRRSTTVGLTPAGRRLIDRALPLHLDAERSLLQALPEAEQRRLTNLLAKTMRGSDLS